MSVFNATPPFVTIAETPTAVVITVARIDQPRITVITRDDGQDQTTLTRQKCGLLFLTVMNAAASVSMTYCAVNYDWMMLGIAVPTGIFSGIFANSYFKKINHN
jgi:hypothetical protein